MKKLILFIYGLMLCSLAWSQAEYVDDSWTHQSGKVVTTIPTDKICNDTTQCTEKLHIIGNGKFSGTVQSSNIASGATVSGANTGDQTSVSGNAGTATAFDHTPTHCNAGYYPNGIDSGGNAVNCASIDLSGYVPYSGATGDVNLGAHSITAKTVTASDDSIAGKLLLNQIGGAHSVGFKAPDSGISSDVLWTLPGADSSGCFKSDGSGNISIGDCGSALTPWTVDIDASNHRLDQLGNTSLNDGNAIMFDGASDDNHQIKRDNDVNGLEFRGYDGFRWNGGAHGVINYMNLNANGLSVNENIIVKSPSQFDALSLNSYGQAIIGSYSYTGSAWNGNGFAFTNSNSGTLMGGLVMNGDVMYFGEVSNSSPIFRIHLDTQAVETNNVTLDDGSGNMTASKFVKSGASSSDFLKGDGSSDSTAYLPTSTVLPANTTSTSHQFFSAYDSSTGAFTKAQPAQADITGLTTGSSPTLTGLTLSGLTINRAMVTNGSNGLASSSVTATELGYVSGVSSAIQTQLNGKQASGSYLTGVTADSPLSGSGTSGSHLVLSTSGTWSGNAGTSTALAANGTNCSAGSYPLGVDASGNSESCTVASTGTVTSIDTTAPLTGGIITGTGTIAIPKATGSVDGYLDHTDLTNFNSKQANLSLVAGTYSDGKWCSYASSGTFLNCNNSPPQVNLGLIAGTLTDGKMCTYTASGTLLSCNTTIPTGTVTSSSLTTNTLPKATGSSALGDSGITDDGALGQYSSTSGQWNVKQVTGIASNTNLLLHFNNNVNDSETTPKTVTNNNVTFSNSIYKFGGYSASFNGTNAYLLVPYSSDWNFGSGDYTVETWVNVTTLPTSGNYSMLLRVTDGGANRGFFLCLRNASGTQHIQWITLYGAGVGNVSVNLDIANTLSTGAWHHIAAVKNGSRVDLYVDGTSIGNANATGISDDPASSTMGIGGDNAGGSRLTGYMDEVRIRKGTASWTTTFTPSTSEYASGVSSPSINLLGDSTTLFSVQPASATSSTGIYNNGLLAQTLNSSGNTDISTRNIVTDTTTGSSFGTGTTQKTSAYGVTPVVQGGATTDLGTILSNWGLRASGTAYPITTSGTVTLTGTTSVTTPTFNGQVYGHQTSPTVASNDCGSTGQGTLGTKSTDIAGKITVGTVAVTSCAITFNTTWTTAPFCVVSDDSHILAVQPSSSTTKLTITALSTLDSDVLTYVCLGGN